MLSCDSDVVHGRVVHGFLTSRHLSVFAPSAIYLRQAIITSAQRIVNIFLDRLHHLRLPQLWAQKTQNPRARSHSMFSTRKSSSGRPMDARRLVPQLLTNSNRDAPVRFSNGLVDSLQKNTFVSLTKTIFRIIPPLTIRNHRQTQRDPSSKSCSISNA